MWTVRSKAEFIDDIRAIDQKLNNIRLNSINVNRGEKSITYNFICDKAVDDELKGKILAEAEKITLPAFHVINVTIKKIACDSQLIFNEVYQFINKHYPSISIFLKETDLSCVVTEKEVRYTLKLTKDSIEYSRRNGLFNKLNDYLGRNFCAEFVGSAEEKEPEETISLLTEEVFMSQLSKIEHRTIKVKEIVIVDDVQIGSLAIYIEDIVQNGVYTVCGKVTSIREKETANGKPMFIIYIDDTTGTLGGIYFSKKATLSKIRDIKEGDCIIARGTMGDYKGKKSFTFDKINRCTFPEGFEKKEKFKKSVPMNYSLITPQKASTVRVKTVFDKEKALPQDVMDTEYVVFDLETTGLDLMSNGITEIGAVKIRNGELVEEWSTLVKPDYNIDAENFKITGISNEMVKDSPKIGQVLPDFIKFIDGCVLVAQNAEFDLKFIKRFAEAEDYSIKNQVLDTMVLSRKYLPQLRRNDLATLADHFGVVFHHHRALSDAYATAEIFIELMKIKAEKGE